MFYDILLFNTLVVGPNKWSGNAISDFLPLQIAMWGVELEAAVFASFLLPSGPTPLIERKFATRASHWK